MTNKQTALQKWVVCSIDAVKLKAALLLPGLCLCFVIVLAAHYVAEHFGGPVILIALVMGMMLRHVANHQEFIAGLDFSAGSILRLGVALLGAKITFAQIYTIGFAPFVFLMVVPATILVSFCLARIMGLSVGQGIISGCAVAICGVAAAVSVAAVLPNKKEQGTYLLCIVLCVTALSTVAMLIYPFLGTVLEWPDISMGLFLGATIHDVAHVAAAGYMVSNDVGDIAIYMKMLRVSLLVPIVAFIAFMSFRKPNAAAGGVGFPSFLLGFVVIALAVNLLPLSKSFVVGLANTSSILLLVAMVALGVKVDFSSLKIVGRKTFLLLAVNTLFLGCVCAFITLIR